MPTASLRALLAHSIDYAGMFPPCSLELEPALRNQAQYVRSDDTWMLSAFVLPVGEFDAARKILSDFDPQHPLRVSALGPKTENAAAFLDAIENVDAAIRSFSASNVDLISVIQLEMFLPQDVDLALIEEARSIIGNLPAFWEARAERSEQTIALLSEHNSNANKSTFGFKFHGRSPSSDSAISRGGANEDARFSQCARRGRFGGGAQVERETDRGHARRRGPEIIFVR